MHHLIVKRFVTLLTILLIIVVVLFGVFIS